MLCKRYLCANEHVRTGLHYFAVPKGDTDIRVVFDSTSSGLNEALWAPNFFLPTARDAALLLSFLTFMADADFGEMFHNFFMDPKVRKHAGVEIQLLGPHLSSYIPLLKKRRDRHLFDVIGCSWECGSVRTMPSIITNGVKSSRGETEHSLRTPWNMTKFVSTCPEWLTMNLRCPK